jgi:nitroreductase
MVRDFTDEPIAVGVVDRLLDAARRGPSAGFSQGLDFVVLEGSPQTRDYWDITLPAERRASFVWPGLLHAPVLVIPVVHAAAYVARYAEPDKASTGLGGQTDDWPVPYWHIDGGAAVMLLLLAAVDEGLGALFFGQFGHEADIAARFGIPADHQAIGTVAVGHPGDGDRPGRSALTRERRPLDEVIHRGHW